MVLNELSTNPNSSKLPRVARIPGWIEGTIYTILFPYYLVKYF
jgi:hypothetical protein